LINSEESKLLIFNGTRPAINQLSVLDIAAFIIPFTRFLEIKVIGNLYISDLELALLLPALVVIRGRLLNNKLPKMFLMCGLLWLLGQVTTDILRHSSFHDYSRGWALIVFTLINFTSLYLLLVGRNRRILLYAFGLALGAIVAYFVNPDIYAQTYHWKFGYGPAVTLLIVLFATFVRKGTNYKPALSSLLMFLAAGINLYMDFRSLSGVCFLAGTYLLMQAFYGRRSYKKVRIKIQNIILIGVVIFIAAIGIFKLYEYAANNGLIGTSAEQKYEAQASGEYGVIIGGRSELLVSIRAIMASPIIGYGSWPKDCHFAALEVQLRRKLGYGNEGSSNSCLLPSHSFVFGTWIGAGILGALFWIWVLILPARILPWLYKTMEPMTPLIAFIMFNITWAILFSPYASEELVTIPYYIVVMIEFYSIYKYGKIMVRQ